MPTFNFDPSSASATLEVLPKGDYEVIIGEPKPFLREGEKGTNYGVYYSLKVLNGPHKDKTIVTNLYMHTPGAGSYAKQFQMAALGYARNTASEREFDAIHAGDDWTFGVDPNVIGDGWRALMGKRIVVSLDTQPNKDRPDELTQQFKGYRPVDASATM